MSEGFQWVVCALLAVAALGWLAWRLGLSLRRSGSGAPCGGCTKCAVAEEMVAKLKKSDDKDQPVQQLD